MATTTLPPLHAGPAVGFEAPFEMLEACHQRVERMLVLLERLDAHLATLAGDPAADARAGQAAQDVMRYFDLAGPAHHEDEERHVLPRLRAAADPALQALATRLAQEHIRMVSDWAAVRADLAALHVPGAPAVDAARSARWAAFAALYRAHIVAEEASAYPAARPGLDAATLAAMGEEMARRRGARAGTAG